MASQIRLELSTTNPDLQDGLQARIHDPLWILARQWQFGEFNGADAGSPAAAQVLVDTTHLNRYRPGPPSSSLPARAMRRRPRAGNPGGSRIRLHRHRSQLETHRRSRHPFASPAATQ